MQMFIFAVEISMKLFMECCSRLTRRLGVIDSLYVHCINLGEPRQWQLEGRVIMKSLQGSIIAKLRAQLAGHWTGSEKQCVYQEN